MVFSYMQVTQSIFQVVTFASPKPRPDPEAEAAPIAYDLGGILNALIKIVYALLRGENVGLG